MLVFVTNLLLQQLEGLHFSRPHFNFWAIASAYLHFSSIGKRSSFKNVYIKLCVSRCVRREKEKLLTLNDRCCTSVFFVESQTQIQGNLSSLYEKVKCIKNKKKCVAIIVFEASHQVSRTY